MSDPDVGPRFTLAKERTLLARSRTSRVQLLDGSRSRAAAGSSGAP